MLIPAAAILTRVSDMAGVTATGGKAAGKLGYAYHLDHPLSRVGANNAAIEHAGRIHGWIKNAGRAAPFVSTGISGYQRYAIDGLKHPEMETTERVARALAEGSSVGVAGWAASSATTTGVGTVSWVGGPGGAAGGAAGRYVERHNDAAVDFAGNLGEGAADIAERAWDRLTNLEPWG